MSRRALIPDLFNVAPHGLPRAQGLYDPANEHDSCGVGFVADLKGRKSHQIIEYGLQILENLTHRGAAGADPRDGDGAGMLVQIPHAFFQEVCPPLNIKLPEPGHYAVGQMFMPSNQAQRIYCESVVERVVDAEGLKLLGWRNVPTDNATLSPEVVESEPTHRQVFIGRGPDMKDDDEFERRLYLLRKVINNTINGETGGRDIGFYTASLSCRTLVYKGMFLAYQLGAYYQDLHDPKFTSALALVHQRQRRGEFRIVQVLVIGAELVGEEHALVDERAAGQRCGVEAVSYTHLRAHETVLELVCRLLLEKKKRKEKTSTK